MRGMILRLAMMVLLSGLLSACATPVNHSQSLHREHALTQWPLLAPSMWGQDVSAQQLLTIQAGEQQHEVQTVLDISNQAVHLVVLKFGRRLVTIEHTALGTRVDKEKYVPEFIDAQQVLRDMQLVYAPLSTLQATLPMQCTITAKREERYEQRVVRCADQILYQIETEFDKHDLQKILATRLINEQIPYTIDTKTIQTKP